MSHFTVARAAEFYSIPLIDYCAGDDVPDRWGVLIGSGCGIMMAVMDIVHFRWCVDADEVLRTERGAYRLEQFIAMAHVARDGGCALAGWFSITDPAPFKRAFGALDPPGVVYAGGTWLGVPGETISLLAFIEAAKRRWDPIV